MEEATKIQLDRENFLRNQENDDSDYDSEWDDDLDFDEDYYDEEDYDDEEENYGKEDDEFRRRVLKKKEVKEFDYIEPGSPLEQENKKKDKDSFESLFFFTDQEFFSSIRYEYLSPKEPKKGFIFALFVPQL